MKNDDAIDLIAVLCILFVFMRVLYCFCVAAEFSANKDLYIIMHLEGPNDTTGNAVVHFAVLHIPVLHKVVHGSILCDPNQPNPSADWPNPLEVGKFEPNPTRPNTTTNGAYSLAVTYFYTQNF